MMTPIGSDPYLMSVALDRDSVPSFEDYPFCIPAVRNLHELEFHPKVTYFVGDNGTGTRGKGTVTELGVRVPFIAWGPGWFHPTSGATTALGDLTDIMPTLAGLAGAQLPKDKVFDGKSMVPLLRGETSRHREWIYSYLDDGRILRNDRWLLEIPGQGKPERFFDCGQSRNGRGYRRVTQPMDAEARSTREHFAQILAGMPEPKPNSDVTATAPARARQRNRR